MQKSPFGLPQFDPSKMDPQVLMQLSQLIQKLPADKLNRMQTLMHNMMAGHDVRREMEEFEQGLPAGFRDQLLGLMAGQAGAISPAPMMEVEAEAEVPSEPMNMREARLTILRAVAAGKMMPEEAEKLLFTA